MPGPIVAPVLTSVIVDAAVAKAPELISLAWDSLYTKLDSWYTNRPESLVQISRRLNQDFPNVLAFINYISRNPGVAALAMNDLPDQYGGEFAELIQASSDKDLKALYQLTRASSPNPTEKTSQIDVEAKYKDEFTLIAQAINIVGSFERLAILHNALNLDRSHLALYRRQKKLRGY